jgi:DNA-binding winged helix-turn-helix (wHTH) protein/tetratricopeptide (TPR) repeat protein
MPLSDNKHTAMIRFGPFELDTRTGELRKRGVRLKLAHQAYLVLRVLLDAPGQVVTRDHVKAFVWPKRKAADFDSGINKSISQLRAILGDNGPNPRYIETCPRHGYRFISPLSGGPAREDSGERAVAVLQFENLTGDPSLAYIGEGIAEALTMGLGALTGIRVICRTSAKASVATGNSLQAIGRDLRVNTVVEGSVMGTGALRVNIRVVDIGSARILWQNKYDCEPDALLPFCDRLVDFVRIEIGGSGPRGREPRGRPTQNPSAHLAYLKGRYFWNKRTEKDICRSIDEFKEALRIEADFALAHAGLADAYVLLGIWGLERPEIAFGQARQSAERAIQLDDSLAEAHTCHAEVLKDHEWDFIGAENEFRRAIALNPNYSTAHHFYSQLLVTLGRFSEAAEEIELARRVDPLAASINAYVPYIYLAARDYARAVREGQRAVELEPQSAIAHWQLGRAVLFAGDHGRAIHELETASTLANGRTMWRAELCFARARSGDRSGAEEILAELTSLEEHAYVSPYDLALCAAGLGEFDAALDYLERAYRDRVMRIISIGDPEFDGMRRATRFVELTRKLHLPARAF